MAGWVALIGVIFVAWGLGRLLLGYPKSPHPMMFRSESAFITAVSDVMFPPGGEIPESGTEAGIPGFLDRYLAAVPPRQRILIRALFFLMEHSTLFFPAPSPRGWRRFSSLSAEQQQAFLEGWRSSGLFARRTVFLALRSLLTMGFFACPAVMRRLDVAPAVIDTPVVEADVLFPPIGEPRSAIRVRAEDVTGPGLDTPLGLDAPLHPDFREEPS